MNGDRVLYRDGELSYFVLTPDYKNEAHEILAEIFCDMPPCIALKEHNPDMEIKKEVWFEYVGNDIDDFVTEGLSIITFGKLT